MQILELPKETHPFFFSTQAHAELTSRPLDPEPIFVGLVHAAMIYSGVSEAAPMPTVPRARQPAGEHRNETAATG